MNPKKGLKPQLAHAEETILRAPVFPLTLDDRTALRAMYESQAFRRAWANVKLAKPSVFTGELNSALGAIVANNRLHEIRGWELLEAALLKELNEPKPPVTRKEETWPDAGLDIVDPNKLPKSPPPAPLPLHPKPTKS